MERTINVKGIGFVSAKPDYIELPMTMETLDLDYDKAYQIATDKNDILIALIEGVGFKKENLKTSSFDINQEYNTYRDENDKYVKEFLGYKIVQRLKLSFDLDMEKLSDVLSVIGHSNLGPNISIKFTLKDPTVINDKLLEAAAKNARKKAEILCQASGVELGDLLSITYNWTEIDIFSETRLNAPKMFMAESTSRSIDIEPEDIDVRDTANFLWKIK